MQKDIVLLSKSRKYNNYCVAGKDIKTGQWIRLISRDEDISNAIEPKDLIYSDGSEAKILDVVRVTLEEVDNINRHQPENYYLNTDYYLGYEGRLSKRNLYDYVDYSEDIFFNTENCVSKYDLNYIQDVNSLLIVEVDYMKVRVKPHKEKRLTANIKYNGIWYNNLSITDTEFIEKYYDEVAYGNDGKCFYNKTLVISLGECYKGNHYKLIATVLD